jgi:hypothetical protein
MASHSQMTVFVNASPSSKKHDGELSIRDMEKGESKHSVLFTKDVVFERFALPKGKTGMIAEASHWLVVNKQQLGEIRNCNTKNDTNRVISAVVDDANVLRALEIQKVVFPGEDGTNVKMPIIHLKAVTQAKDQAVKEGKQLAVRARFDKAMLWNLNNATLEAIAQRIENDEGFYNVADAGDAAFMHSKISAATSYNLEDINTESIEGWSKTTEFGEASAKGGTNYSYADAPMSKRMREVHDELDAAGQELKKMRSLISSMSTLPSGEIAFTLNIKNAKCTATDHSVMVVGVP